MKKLFLSALIIIEVLYLVTALDCFAIQYDPGNVGSKIDFYHRVYELPVPDQDQAKDTKIVSDPKLRDGYNVPAVSADNESELQCWECEILIAEREKQNLPVDGCGSGYDECSSVSMDAVITFLTTRYAIIKPDIAEPYMAENDLPETDSESVYEEITTIESSDEGSAIGRELIDGLSWRFNLLAYSLYRKPVTYSVINLNNRQNISSWENEANLRPDADLNFRRLSLSVKPRWKINSEKWEEGQLKNEQDTEDDLFINEWSAQFMVTDELFFSYGRENLQWGPSYLISPSNPFIKDNGRDNPKVEVEGLDYGQVVWIPHYEWSLSFIANTDEGRYDFVRNFETTYALKLDYTGYQKYFSLIPSYRESDSNSDVKNLGFFAGWSVSDALLIYGEGNIRDDSKSEDSTEFETLFGASYTFEMGPTLAAEYFNNEKGLTGPIGGIIPPFGTANPDDILLRRYYGLLQLSDSKVSDYFNYIIRWIYNIDDHSNRTITILECEFGDHYKVFSIGDYSEGESVDEFGSIVNYSIYFGLEVTF